MVTKEGYMWFKYKGLVQFLSLVCLDIIAYYISLFIAVFLQTNLHLLMNFSYIFTYNLAPFTFTLNYAFSIWWIPLVFILVMTFEKLYLIRYPFWDETRVILKSVTIATVFIVITIIIRNMYGNISRSLFIYLWFILIFVQPTVRFFGKKLLYRIGVWKDSVLIIGAGNSAIETVKGLISDGQLGYHVIGFLDDDPKKINTFITINHKKYKVYGKVSQFTKFIRLLDISNVIIAMPHLSREKLSILTASVQKYTKSVLVVPDLAGIAQVNTELYYLFMQKIFLLKIKNNLKSGLNQATKWLFNMVISIILLPILLPVIAVIAVLIRLDSKGPAFIIQERLGIHDTIFKCIKFRTMFLDSDRILDKHLRSNPDARQEWKKYKKLKGYDPRVTRIGKFLRRVSLDELPQIFNVLKGEMSLVGPRPYLPREKSEIMDYVDDILLTNPGITGLWQISGRNELIFEERLKLDTWYVQNWSLWLDIIIIFKTVPVVFKRKGAY